MRRIEQWYCADGFEGWIGQRDLGGHQVITVFLAGLLVITIIFSSCSSTSFTA